MSLGESISADILSRTELAAVLGNRVAQNHIPEGWGTDGAYLVYLRRGTEGEHTLDAAPGSAPFREYYDVEIYGPDIAEVDELAEWFKSGKATFSGYNLYRGNFGTGKVQGIFVTDQTDDYQPRVTFHDEGLHGAFLNMQIAGFTE